jgi:hypothetical protein
MNSRPLPLAPCAYVRRHSTPAETRRHRVSQGWVFTDFGSIESLHSLKLPTGSTAFEAGPGILDPASSRIDRLHLAGEARAVGG